MKHFDLSGERKDFFLTLSKSAKGGLSLAVVLGIVTFITGLLVGEQSRTWGSFLFNLMFFFSIALGGVAFGNMQDVVGALWGRPIKRIHESFGAFLPWATGFIILYLLCIKLEVLGAQNVYRWVSDSHLLDHFPGKNVWLQFDFMMIRDIIAILITLGLASWHFRLTVKPDLAMVNGKDDEARAQGEQARRTLRHWSAPVLCVYSITFSLLTFDLTMSLAPTWFSTLWGGWSFAILMQTFLSMTLLFMFYLKSKPVGEYIGRQQFHDMGKLLFGFTVFFAYLTYAHVLTYWYGNVPEETSYFIRRMEAPWIYLIIASPILSFAFPFFVLIPKPSKWTRWITIPVCLVVLAAQWMNYLLVVIPEVVKPEDWQVPWIEGGVFLGFLGLFLFSIFRFGRAIPMLSIADPLLPESLNSGH